MWLSLLVFIASAREASLANPMLHVANGALVDGQGRHVLLRCVNLSPWLIPEGYLIGQASLAALTTSPSEVKQRLEEIVGPDEARAFWQEWINNFVVESDFQHLKSHGFNCVRLPLNYGYLVGSDAGGTIAFAEAQVAPVDHAVAWAAAYGLYVILDLHDAPGGQNPLPSVADVSSGDKVARLWRGPTAAANQTKTIAFWRTIAARFSGAAGLGGYDLLNEPALPSGIAKEVLAQLYQHIVEAVRQVDGEHLIVLEGDSYAHDFSALKPPPDENVMYEFHEYAFFNPRWRTPVQQTLEPFLELRSATKMPLWLGEFGENSLEWHVRMVRLMKANDIGWSVWPWKRIDLMNGHPAVETIHVPASWKAIAGYLVGAWLSRRPARAEAELAIREMLQATKSANCAEDRVLEDALAGGQAGSQSPGS
ncbi:MAG TPA: glycoside hydrolase family 5 protein [Steroidobacteraceae bacterium]|nr:glycoside hydrolase family 5 protein [Steroidobacteraceae bacterium]